MLGNLPDYLLWAQIFPLQFTSTLVIVILWSWTRINFKHQSLYVPCCLRRRAVEYFFNINHRPNWWKQKGHWLDFTSPMTQVNLDFVRSFNTIVCVWARILTQDLPITVETSSLQIDVHGWRVEVLISIWLCGKRMSWLHSFLCFCSSFLVRY